MGKRRQIVRADTSEDEPASRRRSAGWSFLFAATVAVLTPIPFWPALSCGFVNWDDPGLVLNNSHIRSLDAPQIRWMFTAFHMGPYQPLAWLSLATDHALWGMDPRGFHRTALILHTISAVSFFWLSRRLLLLVIPDAWRSPVPLDAAAALAALVFAVHPLRVESVVWVSERRDVLAVCFAIWTVLAYLRTADLDRHGAPRTRWLVIALVCYLASLLSKASTVTLPAMLSLLDYSPLGRLGGAAGWWRPAARRAWLEKIPFWLLSAAAALAAVYGQRQTGAMTPVAAYGVLDRLVLAGFSAAFYVIKTVLPFGLSPMYELPVPFDPLAARFLLPCLAAVLATGALMYFRRRLRVLLVVWLSYLFLLAPVSGLVQAGAQASADRYSYLCTWGFAILLGGVLLKWTLGRAGDRPGTGRTPTAVLIGIWLLMLPLTWFQSTHWHDSEALWRHALRVTPRSAVARVSLGCQLADEGRLDEGLALFEQAIRIHPRYSDAHDNLGGLLRRIGRPAQALEHLIEAWRLQPSSSQLAAKIGLALIEEPHLPQLGFDSIDAQWQAGGEWFERALEADPHMATALNGLGIVAKRRGKLDDAARYYERSMLADPTLIDPMYNSAILLAERGDEDEAIRRYRQVLSLRPAHARASNDLAIMLERRGDCRAAIAVLRDAVARSADRGFLLYRLCWTLATSRDDACRDGATALSLGERLVQLTGGNDPDALDALAAALAESARFDEAAERAASALELASENQRPELVEQIRQRIELYQSGKPFRSQR